MADNVAGSGVDHIATGDHGRTAIGPLGTFGFDGAASRAAHRSIWSSEGPVIEQRLSL